MKINSLYHLIFALFLLGSSSALLPMESVSTLSDSEIGENECGICLVDYAPKQLVELVCNKKICRTCLRANGKRVDCPFCLQPWNGYTGIHTDRTKLQSKPNIDTNHTFIPLYVLGGVVVTAAASYGAYRLYRYFIDKKQKLVNSDNNKS